MGCTDPSGTPDHGLHAHKPRLNSQESDAAAHVAAARGGPSYLSGPWNAVTGVMCPQAGPRRKPGCPQPTAVGPSLAGAGRFETAPPGNGSVVDRRGGHGHRHPARRADLILCDALQRAPDSRNQPGCASSSAVPSDSGSTRGAAERPAPPGFQPDCRSCAGPQGEWTSSPSAKLPGRHQTLVACRAPGTRALPQGDRCTFRPQRQCRITNPLC